MLFILCLLNLVQPSPFSQCFRNVKHWFFLRKHVKFISYAEIETNYLLKEINWTEIVLIQKVTQNFATFLCFSLTFLLFYDRWMCRGRKFVTLFSLCSSFTMKHKVSFYPVARFNCFPFFRKLLKAIHKDLWQLIYFSRSWLFHKVSPQFPTFSDQKAFKKLEFSTVAQTYFH